MGAAATASASVSFSAGGAKSASAGAVGVRRRRRRRTRLPPPWSPSQPSPPSPRRLPRVVDRLGHLGLRRRVVAPSAARVGAVIFLGLGLGLGAFAASAAAFACARSCCSATMGVMTSMILMAANAAVGRRARGWARTRGATSASRVAPPTAMAGMITVVARKLTALAGRPAPGSAPGRHPVRHPCRHRRRGSGQTLADDRAGGPSSSAAALKLSASRACHGTSP